MNGLELDGVFIDECTTFTATFTEAQIEKAYKDFITANSSAVVKWYWQDKKGKIHEFKPPKQRIPRKRKKYTKHCWGSIVVGEMKLSSEDWVYSSRRLVFWKVTLKPIEAARIYNKGRKVRFSKSLLREMGL